MEYRPKQNININRLFLSAFKGKFHSPVKKKIKTLKLREEQEIRKRNKNLAEIWYWDEQFYFQNFLLSWKN